MDKNKFTIGFGTFTIDFLNSENMSLLGENKEDTINILKRMLRVALEIEKPDW